MLKLEKARVFSPDGKTLAKQSGRGVQLWETSTWGRLTNLESEGLYGLVFCYSDDDDFAGLREESELLDVFSGWLDPRRGQRAWRQRTRPRAALARTVPRGIDAAAQLKTK